MPFWYNVDFGHGLGRGHSSVTAYKGGLCDFLSRLHPTQLTSHHLTNEQDLG